MKNKFTGFGQLRSAKKKHKRTPETQISRSFFFQPTETGHLSSPCLVNSSPHSRIPHRGCLSACPRSQRLQKNPTIFKAYEAKVTCQRLRSRPRYMLYVPGASEQPQRNVPGVLFFRSQPAFQTVRTLVQV